jgi:hypothetical protein
MDEEAPKRGGAEGSRFTGSTEDSRPMNLANSVEEKTLMSRKGETNIPGLATLRASSKVGGSRERNTTPKPSRRF